jgi:hypothetical protein
MLLLLLLLVLLLLSALTGVYGLRIDKNPLLICDPWPQQQQQLTFSFFVDCGFPETKARIFFLQKKSSLNGPFSNWPFIHCV